MIYQTDSASISYDIHHEQFLASNTPLLFLHSALGTRCEFDKLVAYYDDRTLITLDFPSHGESTTSRERLTIRDLADDVHSLLDSLQIPVVDIIGYSMGGYVAITLALQSPERVRSVVSHAMKFYWSEEAISKAFTGLGINNIKARSEKAYITLEQAHTANGLERTSKLAAIIIESFRESQLSEQDIAHIQCPLLLSTGDSDAMVTAEEITRLYQNLEMKKKYLAIEPHSPHQFSKLDFASFTESVRIFWRTV